MNLAREDFVKIEKIEENLIHIRDLDILDGTPLLDIKPYVPPFDAILDALEEVETILQADPRGSIAARSI